MIYSKVLLLALAIVGTSLCYEHPVSEELVQEIKASATWTPMEVDENPFAYYSLEEIQALMGTKLDDDLEGIEMDEIEFYEGEDLEDYPENFDGRVEFGDFIHPIRDQQQCGSCWAFGAVTAFSDRYTIASKGEQSLIFSPQDMVSCSRANYACKGGFVPKAWNYIKKAGVVLDSCHPYTSGESKVRGTCLKKCVDDSEMTRYYSGKLQHASSTKGARAMIQEGPVEGAFTVYEDFMSYKSGVYQHKTGKMLGGHAIKILGWGKEDGLYYWLCANSWNVGWGDQGFFKIQMGQVGINNKIYAANPIVKSLEQEFME